MSFTIHYRRVCSVRIGHDPSLDLGKVEFDALPPSLREQRLDEYDIRQLLAIVPTDETAALFDRHRLRLRHTPLGIEIAGSAVPDEALPGAFKLERPLEDGVSLWFHLIARSNGFSASANLPLDEALGKIGHFTNRNVNPAGDGLHLSKPVPEFSNTAAYRAGDLIVDDVAAPTVLLEARRDLAPAASAAGADWLELPFSRFVAATAYTAGDIVLAGGVAYVARTDGSHPAPPSAQWNALYTPALRTGVTRNDLITAFPRNFRVLLPAATTFAVFRVKNAAGDIVLSGTRFHDDGSAVETLDVSLPHAVPGIHRLEAETSSGVALAGFPIDFLLAPGVGKSRPIGVIELHQQAGPQALCGPGGRLTDPVFCIRFRKRHSYWRYTFHGDLSDLPPADPGDLLQENPADPARYVSAAPLPLTAGLVPLRTFGEKTRLPNPPPGQVRRDGDKLFSDCHIHL